LFSSSSAGIMGALLGRLLADAAADKLQIQER
jgi:hypothetical protein